MKMKILLWALCGVFFLSSSIWADSWLDDWVDAKTTTSAGYYSGQNRNYFSGGSFQARWKMSHEKIIDFSPPRIASGCGGIDIFGGGLSFMDADRLVEKLQSAVQAAPAVAFDMALKTMCKECSDTVRALEEMANKLNGLVQSDCQNAQRLAQALMPEVPENNALNEVAGRLNQKLGLTRDYYEHDEKTIAADGNPGVDLRQATASCSDSFKAIFSEGSLIQKIATDLSFEPYADLLRGLLGDVVIRYNDTKSAYDMDTVSACRVNKSDTLSDFLNGSVQERPLGAACRDNASTDFYSFISSRLNTIADKMKDGSVALDPDEISFIDSAPLPVELTLRYGLMTGNIEGAVISLRDALSIAYAYRAIDDLYQNLNYLMAHASQVSRKADGSAGSPDFCNPIVFVKAMHQVKDWEESIQAMRLSVKSAYQTEIQHLANYQIMIRNIMTQNLMANQQVKHKVKE